MSAILTVHSPIFGYRGTPVVSGHGPLIFESGTFNLLLGGNGAGKSTVMRTLVGEIPLLSGSIEYGKTGPISAINRIGFVEQRLKVPTILPITVFEFVLLGATRLSHSNIANSAEELLEAVSLTGYRDTLLRYLSVGQLQRAGIARELLGEPAIFFLDESTAGVDREHQPRIFSLLESKRSEMTVVLATHDLHHLTTAVDWVYSIEKGQIKRAALGEVQCC